MSVETLTNREAAPPEERASNAQLVTCVIEPSRNRIGIDWGELWRYRELLYFLTWRDVKVRYKQTVLGAAWAILQPVMTMIVFTIFFGKLAGLSHKTGGVPYPIHVYSALLLWTFFSNAVTTSSGSLVGSANLVTKVYFPRLVIPIAAVGAGLVDLMISAVVLLVMAAYYGIGVSSGLVFAPVFLVGTILAATGVGAYLAALTVAYRDFRYVVPFMIQVWMFVTPVIYPSSIVPGKWRWLLSLNPMCGLIDGFRACLLSRPIDWGHTILSLGIALLFFLCGSLYFRKVERRFADII